MNSWVMPQGGARGQNLGHPNKVDIAVCLYKQPLNKEEWASDMFITSTFCVSCSSDFALDFEDYFMD